MGNLGHFDLPWEARVAESVAARDGELLYLKSALYPVLEVTVRIREKSREQLGALEETVLGLLAISPMSIEQLGFGLGMHERRVVTFVEEIVARGLATREQEQEQDARYRLASLGTLSLKEGAIVFESEWTLRLCGITGRPLPSGLYERTFLSPSDLRSNERASPSRTSTEPNNKATGHKPIAGSIILESQEVSLEHLNLKVVGNPRTINLPPETLEITGVLCDSAKSGYVHGTIVCHRTKSSDRQWELHFGKHIIDWLDEQKIIGMIEPLGAFNNVSSDECLKLIERQLEKIGCQISRSSLCQFGNPQIILKTANNSMFRPHGKMRPLGLYVGTTTTTATPLTYFSSDLQGQDGKTRTMDLLRGRALVLRLEAGSKLETDVDIFRKFTKVMASVERQMLLNRYTEADPATAATGALNQVGLTAAQLERALSIMGYASLEDAVSRMTHQP